MASFLQDQLEEVAELFSSLFERGYDADFDEDLLLLIGSLIKLGRKVSRRARRVAGGVERFVAKVKGCFGNSWDTAVAWAMWEEEGGEEDGRMSEGGGNEERGGEMGEGGGGKGKRKGRGGMEEGGRREEEGRMEGRNEGGGREESGKEGKREVVWSMLRAAKMSLLTDETISNEANQGQALLLMQLMLQVKLNRKRIRNFNEHFLIEKTDRFGRCFVYFNGSFGKNEGINS